MITTQAEGFQGGLRRFTVLYVEDDDPSAYLFHRALNQRCADLEIIRFKDGKQALGFLLGDGVYAGAAAPHLVVLDLNTPNKNGFDILFAIQRQNTLRSIPVVVLSASIHPNDRDRAYELGASEFFVKPSDWNGYVETAEKVRSLLPMRSPV